MHQSRHFYRKAYEAENILHWLHDCYYVGAYYFRDYCFIGGLMIIAWIWIVLCFVIAAGASSRGRSGVGWFFISALLSPVIAVIMLVCLRPIEDTQVETVEKDDKELQAFLAWRKQQKLDTPEDV